MLCMEHGFIKTLETILKNRWPPSSIYLACEPGHTGSGNHIAKALGFDAMICLQGVSHYRIRLQKEVVSIRLQAGDALFRAPQTWITVTPKQSYTTMGVNFVEEETRFRIVDRVISAGASTPGVCKTRRQIASTALNNRGRQLARILISQKRRSPQSPYLSPLLELLLREAQEILEETPCAERAGKAKATFTTACDYIENNWNKELSRTTVAAAVGIQPGHLSRLFAQYANQSFPAYVRQFKLDYACELLKEPKFNVSDVAAHCGFSNVHLFIRVFKQTYGVTPGKFKENL